MLFYHNNNSWLDRCFYKAKSEELNNLFIEILSRKKGLEIYAYCLMHSHLHMVCRAKGGIKLSDIIRDFKKITSKKIIKTILNEPESRREWMLSYFKEVCSHLKRKQKYKVWQDGYHRK